MNPKGPQMVLFAEQLILKPPPNQLALKAPPTAQEFQLSHSFQERLHSGIIVDAYFNKCDSKKSLILKSLKNCRALMTITDSKEQRLGVFDIRNMAIQQDSLRAEAAHPELEELPYLQVSDRFDKVVVLLKTEQEKSNILEGLRMQQRICNAIEPYDEDLSIPSKLFCLAYPQNTAPVDQFNRFISQLVYVQETSVACILRLVRTNNSSNLHQVTYPQFIQFMKWTLANRPEIIDVFNKYCENKVVYSEDPDHRLMTPLMSLDEFINFLVIEQRQSQREIAKILKKVNVMFGIHGGFSVYAFSRFLYSNANNIFHPHLRRVYQDMGRPLNHYYCYSSHNTYLTGNQLISDSSAERYIEDLENGLRCVEIDVHNDYTSIKVTHGFTRTSKISFERVVQLLAKFSDRNPNHLPIMLSIEVHLNWRNKQVMVDILLHYLKRKIFIIEKDFVQYPTALELRNKILIKTYEKISQSLKDDLGKSVSKSVNDVQFFKESKNFLMRLFNMPEETGHKPKGDELFIPVPIDSLKLVKPQTSGKVEIEHTLSKLRQDSLDWNALKKWIMEDPMTCMNKITSMYKGIDHEHEPNFFEYINGDWRSIINVARKDSAGLVRYTSKGWCRVYPFGLEFNSANFNPIPFLEMGVQYISLNTQARQSYRYIQHAHFSENFCGYLLKPKNLIRGKFVSPSHIQFQIKVISAFNIRDPITQSCFEYCIRLGFFGSVVDCIPKNQNGKVRQVTETVKKPNVCFEYSDMHTFEMKQPYFSFILLEVTGLGCTAVPVRVMQSGYRIVQILDENYKPIPSVYLLVWVNIKELDGPTKVQSRIFQQ